MTHSHGSAVPLRAPSEAEDDQDLLTYAIAADRLREEIAQAEEALAAEVDSARAAQLRQRLEQLNRVLDGHTAARVGRVNDRDFFGEQTP